MFIIQMRIAGKENEGSALLMKFDYHIADNKNAQSGV